MTEDLDKYLDELEIKIDEDVLKDYGHKAYEVWKNPLHAGQMANPSASAVLTGSCGDSMHIFIKVKDGVIDNAQFHTTGCGPSIVSGSTACTLSIGKTLEQAAGLDGKDILETLGGLPEEKEHCSFLAAETMRTAVSNYWDSEK